MVVVLLQVEKAVQGELKEWETEPKPSLALIILTDQFTRSIFRVGKITNYST